MPARTPLAPLAGALLTLALPLGAAADVDVARIGDINQVGADSSPSQFVELGSARIFVAFTPATGGELFISRGGAADTELLKEVAPGPADAGITGLQPAVLGGRDVLIFWTGGFGTGGDLWRTDGTAAGTFPIVTGVTVRNAAAVPALERVVFDGDDGTTGQEPWITDGTLAGTLRLADIRTGASGSTPAGFSARTFAVSGSRIYFTADDGSIGTELWTSGGTPGDPTLVDELVEAPFEPRSFRHLEPDGTGGLYFTADTASGSAGDGNDRPELWFSADGTNTAMVPFDGAYDDQTPVRDIRVLPSGEVYFADGFGDLFRTDGSSTERVVMSGTTTPFAPTAQDLSRVLVEFTRAGRISPDVYALGRAEGDDDHELWRISGATAVEAVSETGSDPDRTRPRGLTVSGGRMFFAADDGTSGLELWSSDGTSAGTGRVTEIAAGDASGVPGTSGGRLAAAGTGVVFAGFDTAGGVEPWFSSGTAAGTERIADLRPGTGDAFLVPGTLQRLGDAVLLSAFDAERGRELWRIDDTGVSLVKDIRAGGEGAFPGELIVLGDKAYFRARTDATGNELWVTDGTATGTQIVDDIRAGTVGSRIRGLTRIGDRILFKAYGDDTTGNELWVSDGTAAGTQLLVDIDSRPGRGSRPDGFAVIDSRVYFSADDGVNGREPWRSDGTAAGTLRLGDIETGPGDSNPAVFLPVGDKVYFEANDSAVGREPRVYDPQTDTVTLLADITGDATGSLPRSLATSTGDAVYFAASDAASGNEPWVTDGTPGGTRRLGDIAAGADGSDPSGFTEYQGAVYFAASEPATGRELYRYDPAADTVTRITDLGSGAVDGLPGSFDRRFRFWQPLVFDGRLFFAGIDAQGGQELWSTDGTTAGTRREADIVQGADGSATVLLDVIGDTLYLSADDGATGEEPWRVTAVSDSGSGGSGGSGGNGSGGGGGGGGGAGIAALLLLGMAVLARVRRRTGAAAARA